MKNKNLQRQLIAAVLYCLPFIFFIKPWHRYLLFSLGVLLGILLLILDEERLHRFYQEDNLQSLPDLPDAAQKDSPGSKFIVTRSTLFLLSLLPLSLFVVSSTGSALGIGLVMGLMLGLLIEMWMLRNEVDQFRQRFLRQLKTEMSAEGVSLLVLGGSVFFALMNFWAVLLR